MKQTVFHSFEQLEATLQGAPVPYPELETFQQKVVRSLQAPAKRARLKAVPMLYLCIALFGVLSATAYAVIDNLILRNNDGEVVLEYKPLPQEQIDKDRKTNSIRNEWKSEMYRIEQGLSPGEMAYMLVVEAYEIDRVYFPIQKPTSYRSLEQLKQATTTTFKTPAMPGDAIFEEGLIAYSGEEIEAEKLYQATKSSGNPYGIQKVKLFDKAETIQLTYKQNVDGINMPAYSIFINEAPKQIMSSNMQGMEIIKITGADVLYNSDMNSIMFITEHDGKKQQYQIFGVQLVQNPNPKEDLLKIAESILSQP